LFRNEALDDLEPCFDSQSPLLSGLSGILTKVAQPTSEAEQGLPPNTAFRVHQASYLNEILKPKDVDVIPLDVLFYLYLGFLPSGEGKLYFPRVPSGWQQYNSRLSREVILWEITSVDGNSIPRVYQARAKELGLSLPNVYALKARSFPRDFSQIRWILSEESEEGHSPSASEYYRLKREVQSFDVDVDSAIWIHRSTIHKILHSVPKLTWGSQWFLYPSDPEEEPGLFQMAFNSGWLDQSVSRSIAVVERLSDPESLRSSMKELLAGCAHD